MTNLKIMLSTLPKSFSFVTALQDVIFHSLSLSFRPFYPEGVCVFVVFNMSKFSLGTARNFGSCNITYFAVGNFIY